MNPLIQNRTTILPLLIALGTHAAIAQRVQCPEPRTIVYIQKVAQPNDPMAQKAAAKNLVNALAKPNTVVLLAPDVDIDFSGLPEDPSQKDSPVIVFGQCVTLASYQPETNAPPVIARSGGPAATASGASSAPETTAARSGLSALTGVGIQPAPGSGRTPRSVGPVLRFGTNAIRGDSVHFLEISCGHDSNGDGARISGFRLFGPDFNDHYTNERGINISGCHDVEISNMEIAGWGETAIYVDDAPHVSEIPKQEPDEILVKIHDNYIHHNQHSSHDHSAGGYGVNVGLGGFADIFQNVFDYNRHAITAGGMAGGYHAVRNLVLKGGGYHGAFYERDIHIFDVHGTANCPELPSISIGGVPGAILDILVGGIWSLYDWLADASQHQYNCGDAGFRFVFAENTFQYKKTIDIKIRGKPKGQAIITGNIFAWSDQEAAISLNTFDNVVIGPNQYNIDTFGQYGVCDIDGDGVDDLFLTTGVTWWFSSAGQYPWSFLKRDTAVLKDLQLGDVDSDGRCDVIKDAGSGAWEMCSGGTFGWQPLGNFLAPLSEAHLGRFDPNSRDFRPGIKRPPTHAFWRGDGGYWFVTPLSHPNEWQLVGSSSFPFADLRFGDFTGDGVTDVLANEGGHWAISASARNQWQTLNPALNDWIKNQNIFIANMDADDNIDDVLRLDQSVQQGVPLGTEMTTLTWQRSRNGIEPWTLWKRHAGYGFMYPTDNPDYVQPSFGFVGQFGAAPGASTMVIDANRIGHFYSPAQGRDRQEWVSLFAY